MELRYHEVKADVRLTRIKATNFRSFDQLDVPLGKFNVVIGANASGKSNLVEVIRFLRDIEASGLDNAISMQGGSEFVRNIGLGTSKPTSFEFHFKVERSVPFGYLRPSFAPLVIAAARATYRFKLNFASRGDDYDIADEELAITGTVRKQRSGRRTSGRMSRGASVTMRVSRRQRRVAIRITGPGSAGLSASTVLFPTLKHGDLLNLKSLMLERGLPWYMSPATDIAIFDFDPKLPKRATPITGKAVLESDGSNLAIVLKKIVEDPKSRERLSQLVRGLLPFIRNVDVGRFADRSLLLRLEETYYHNKDVPATFTSDGTINLVCLIVALFFQSHEVTVIEEPERNIHPHLISQVVDLLKEASKRNQVILTSHNPEVVRNVRLGELLLVVRDETGFSRVTKPVDSARVRSFLTKDLGLNDLFVNQLFEKFG